MVEHCLVKVRLNLHVHADGRLKVVVAVEADVGFDDGNESLVLADEGISSHVRAQEGHGKKQSERELLGEAWEAELSFNCDLKGVSSDDRKKTQDMLANRQAGDETWSARAASLCLYMPSHEESLP